MIDDSIRRGVESYVARFLRTRVAETLLARDAIRRSITPEDMQRLKTDVLARLEAVEKEGQADREAVGRLVEGLLQRAAGSSASALSALAALLDKAASGQSDAAGEDGEKQNKQNRRNEKEVNGDQDNSE
ncbi:MAG: hypothetical protein GXP54_10795 [Deltaproteobacteria bacterium]|nr:hypothetical protein [Deltaproteobacteria bacterium]